MRRLIWGLLVTLLVTSMVTDVDARRRRKKARKASKQTQFVVLFRLGSGVPLAWTGELQSTALAATSQQSKLKWMPPPQVSLEETRMLLGCQQWDASCVAQIGETLGAARVLYVALASSGQGVGKMQLLDVQVAKPGKAKPQSMSLPDLEATGMALAKAHIRGTILGRVPTTLAVRSVPAGAQVTLDGKAVGAAPLARIEGFEPGPHTIYLTLDGYAPIEKQVVVHKGQALLIQVELVKAAAVVAVAPVAAPDPEPQPMAVPEPTPEVEPEPAPVVADAAPYPHWDSPVAWVGVGLGVAALAGGGALYGAHISGAQPLLDAEQEYKDQGYVSSMTQVQFVEQTQTVEALYFASVVTAAVGGLLAVTGGTLLFVPPPAE